MEEGERHTGQARAGLHYCGVDVNVEGACHAVGVGRGLGCCVMQEQLNKQQSQINQFLQSLSKIESVLNQPTSRPHNSNYQFTPEDLPICLQCRKPGHVLRQCRQGPRQRTASLPNVQPQESPPTAASEQTGMQNIDSSCVTNKTMSPKQDLPPSHNSTPLMGRCPVVEVTMGAVKVQCLLDTGSMVTTITESLFKEAFQHWGAPKLKSCGWLALKAANGLDIPYVG